MSQTTEPSASRYDGRLCAGHLLVWTWRKLVSGQGECPLLAREYGRFAGPRAEALLAAFATFLLLLGRGSRRLLTVGPACCTGLTADEERMLRLIAAVQAEETVLADAHLAWLVRRDGQDVVMAAAKNLAVAMGESGLKLPPARTCTPAPSATLSKMTASGWLKRNA